MLSPCLNHPEVQCYRTVCHYNFRFLLSALFESSFIKLQHQQGKYGDEKKGETMNLKLRRVK